MPTLSAYVNTENTALVILQRKGYRVWYDRSADLFYAEKEGWDFAANGATELLGVIGIFEHHSPKVFKEYWWKIDEPWLKDSVPTVAPEYNPIWRKQK